MGFLTWIENTALAQWFLGLVWGHPILLCFHAVGMGMVVGIIWMLAFRTLGYAKGIPILSLERAFNLAWAGFAMNAGSGVFLFLLNGDAYIKNVPFLIKMASIAGGGVMVWLLNRTLISEAADYPINASRKAKIVAVLALLFWLTAIVAGRIIAYTIETDVPV